MVQVLLTIVLGYTLAKASARHFIDRRGGRTLSGGASALIPGEEKETSVFFTPLIAVILGIDHDPRARPDMRRHHHADAVGADGGFVGG